MRRPRRAAELVLPRTASRAEWLAARRRLIGSSDIADVCGVGRHGPFSVWAEKTGRMPDTGPTVDMARGIDLEDAVVRHWRRYHPELKVTRAGLMRSTRYRRAGATVDRKSRCPDGRCIVEVKTAVDTTEWGSAESPEVPVMTQFQGQWQCFVLGVDHIHYLCMGPRFTIFERVQAHDRELTEWMACEAARFWGRHVVADVPPPAGARDDDVLRRLWPEPTVGARHELDEEECDLMHSILALREALAGVKSRLDDATAALQARVGAATEVYWPDGSVAATWRPTKKIAGMDNEWRRANPELVERHATSFAIPRAVRLRLANLPLPADLALAIALAEPAALDLAALRKGGLPDGLAYQRSWLVKEIKEERR